MTVLFFVKIRIKYVKTIDKYVYYTYNIRIRRADMKRRDLIKKFESKGWWLLKHGGNHDIYTNGTDIEPVPRHKEINEMTAKAIIKRRGL